MTTPPLQPGQYWRTRAGKIVYVVAILPEWASFELPLIVLSKDSRGNIFTDQYTREGGFISDNRESSNDLITYLPECDSLDWAPREYPKYYRGNGDGYFRRDSKTDYVWVSPDGREVKQCGSAEILVLDPFTEITRAEADTRVKKSDAVQPPKYRISDSVPGYLMQRKEGGTWFEFDADGNETSDRKCFDPRKYREVTEAEAKAHRIKPPSHHTAPEVWSLIENADEKNEERFGTPSHGVDKLLIRICSAQQSMLSELSAQVDALRSKQS